MLHLPRHPLAHTFGRNSSPFALKEKCGVFGIFQAAQAIEATIFGLHALQHRGQEAAGIVATDGTKFTSHRDAGLVSSVFQPDIVTKNLAGFSAIGHVRYSTCDDKDSGESAFRNIQPLLAKINHGEIALAHNGNLINADVLRRDLEADGCVFQSTTDTEVIIHLIAKSQEPTLTGRIKDALRQVKGAYSLVILTADELIGVRDPYGFRPLVLGECGGMFMFASETCALDINNATFIREVKPGEIVTISKKGLVSDNLPMIRDCTSCLFEFVYFSRPDSIVNDRSISERRELMGVRLAIESPVEADLVSPVPDSGVPAALGFSRQSSIPFGYGLIRNHYVGRTFISPGHATRALKVALKLNPDRALIKGKRVVLVDDSLVRGTTSQVIVDRVRKAGATEVHMRISCPPVTHPCLYGIDTPEKERLLAHRMSVEEMRKFLGVDSLAFLSLGGLVQSVYDPGANGFCTACFTGHYPEHP